MTRGQSPLRVLSVAPAHDDVEQRLALFHANGMKRAFKSRRKLIRRLDALASPPARRQAGPFTELDPKRHRRQFFSVANRQDADQRVEFS